MSVRALPETSGGPSGMGGEVGGAAQLRTATHDSGGTAPEWDDGVNDVIDNKLLLRITDKTEALVLEVRNGSPCAS